MGLQRDIYSIGATIILLTFILSEGNKLILTIVIALVFSLIIVRLLLEFKNNKTKKKK